MTAILGISAFYHDSAAALVVDGEIIAAAQEERFTRVKHDFGFPKNAIDYCLAAGALLHIRAPRDRATLAAMLAATPRDGATRLRTSAEHRFYG